MSFVLRDPGDISCEWLTECVRDQHPIDDAAVLQIVAGTKHTGQAAQVTQLLVQWSQPVAPSVPQRFCLKTGAVSTAPLLDREVRAYKYLAAGQGDVRLLPRCYHAHCCPESGRYHVLLEDLSETHRAVAMGLPPTENEARQMVQALALLHARWWDQPMLAELDHEPVTEFQVHRLFGHAESHFSVFCERLAGRWMPDDEARCCAALRGGLPLARSRVHQGRHLTVVHGDAHPQNFFLPRDEHASSVLLIDWQTPVWQWRVWAGPCDLAYLFARCWGGRLCPSYERALLEFYYAELLRAGVLQYSLADFWRDYALGISMALAIVVHEALARGAIYWYPQLWSMLASLREQQDVLPAWH